jgi:hypothetical protein
VDVDLRPERGTGEMIAVGEADIGCSIVEVHSQMESDHGWHIVVGTETVCGESVVGTANVDDGELAVTLETQKVHGIVGRLRLQELQVEDLVISGVVPYLVVEGAVCHAEVTLEKEVAREEEGRCEQDLERNLWDLAGRFFEGTGYMVGNFLEGHSGFEVARTCFRI